MKSFTCSYCDSSCGEKVFHNNRDVQTPEFEIYRCKACGLYQIHPTPLDLHLRHMLYERDDYFKSPFGFKVFGYDQYDADWRSDKAQAILDDLEKRIPDLGYFNFLDIGCAFGYMREAAAKRGWSHRGCDVSPVAVQECKTRYGFNTFQGTFEEMVISESQTAPMWANLVFLWDTLEHIPDFKRLLHYIHGHLVPDPFHPIRPGYLALRIPNIDSSDFRATGWDSHFVRFEHLYYFTPPTIQLILGECGFTVCDMWSQSNYHKAENELDGCNLCVLARVHDEPQ